MPKETEIMQNWIVPRERTENVAVLLFPGFSNHCLANAIEPLRAANMLLEREAYRWRFVTLGGDTVTSSSGLPVTPNGTLRAHPGGDTLLVVSGYDVADLATAAAAAALRAAARRFARVAGMDTGAWLMARAGLLDRRPATIHRDEFTAFSERFPDVDALGERYVRDGDRMTCGGAMTAFELVLDLIREAHGNALALDVAALFLHRTGEPDTGTDFSSGASPLVERCIALMSANLEDPLPIEDLAHRMGTTRRTLTRMFRADLGAPPRTVYKRLRLSAARRDARRSNCSVAEIAVRCGYRNAAAMTRAFVAEYGRPPSAFRRR